jgi:hypothetical protein
MPDILKVGTRISVVHWSCRLGIGSDVNNSTRKNFLVTKPQKKRPSFERLVQPQRRRLNLINDMYIKSQFSSYTKLFIYSF